MPNWQFPTMQNQQQPNQALQSYMQSGQGGPYGAQAGAMFNNPYTRGQMGSPYGQNAATQIQQQSQPARPGFSFNQSQQQYPPTYMPQYGGQQQMRNWQQGRTPYGTQYQAPGQQMRMPTMQQMQQPGQQYIGGNAPSPFSRGGMQPGAQYGQGPQQGGNTFVSPFDGKTYPNNPVSGIGMQVSPDNSTGGYNGGGIAAGVDFSKPGFSQDQSANPLPGGGSPMSGANPQIGAPGMQTGGMANPNIGQATSTTPWSSTQSSSMPTMQNAPAQAGQYESAGQAAADPRGANAPQDAAANWYKDLYGTAFSGPSLGYDNYGRQINGATTAYNSRNDPTFANQYGAMMKNGQTTKTLAQMQALGYK